jgi:hypothetical protein
MLLLALAQAGTQERSIEFVQFGATTLPVHQHEDVEAENTNEPHNDDQQLAIKRRRYTRDTNETSNTPKPHIPCTSWRARS